MKAQESFFALRDDLSKHFNHSLKLGFQPTPAMLKQRGVSIGYNDKNELSVYFHFI